MLPTSDFGYDSTSYMCVMISLPHLLLSWLDGIIGNTLFE